MSGLFGGSTNTTVQAAPTPTPPPAMPDSMSPATMEARRLAVAKTSQAGRSSTILTSAARGAQAGSTLAGAYSGTKTGG